MKYLLFILSLFLYSCGQVEGRSMPLSFDNAIDSIKPIENPKVGTITLRVRTLEGVKDTSFEVYKGKSGGLYVIRISGETGKPYKYYLNTDQKAKIK